MYYFFILYYNIKMSSHKDIILKLIDKLMKDLTTKNIIKNKKINK